MRVSPLDIRKQVFKKVMRGADPEEVRMFLDVVASEYEKVIQDNAMMAERIRTLDARVAEFRALEENMRNSLVMADRIATEARESSEREARRVIQDAHSRSERILEDARERLQILVREIEALRGKKEVFARRFWTMIEGQIGVLQEHMADTVEVDSLRQRVSQMAEDARAAAEGAAERAVEEVASRPAPPRASARPEESSAPGYRADQGRQAGPGMGADRSAAFASLAPPAPEGSMLRSSAADAGGGAAPEPKPWSGDGAPRPAVSRPADPAVRRPVPRGLGRLLRGRQSSLPLDEPAPPAEGGRAPARAPEDDSPEPERSVGFFELSASDPRRREVGSRLRSEETEDRG